MPTCASTRWARRRRAITSASTSPTGPVCSRRSPTAFADHGVSIESVRQQMHGEDDADLVIVTHRASDAALSATVEVLRRLEHRARRAAR